MNAFTWPVRVYYEDTDSGGVVYHSNYLNFLERARTEMLRSVGFEQDSLIEQENVIFAVRTLKMDYLKPARFNELLQVKTRISKTGKASLTFAQSIEREQDGLQLCDAEIRVACLYADSLKPRPIPLNIMREIENAG